jgi:hypothetical protein
MLKGVPMQCSTWTVRERVAVVAGAIQMPALSRALCSDMVYPSEV